MQLVPVCLNRIGLPFVIFVAVGCPVDAGDHLHRHVLLREYQGQLTRVIVRPLDDSIVVVDGLVQVDAPVTLLTGKEECGCDGRHGGKMILQYVDGLGRRQRIEGLVQRRVSGRDDGEMVVQAPAFGDGTGASETVPAAVDFGGGDVALPVTSDADVVVGVVGGTVVVNVLAIAAGEKGLFQAVGQVEQRRVVV